MSLYSTAELISLSEEVSYLVLKLLEPRGLEQRDRRREDWGSGGERRRAGRSEGGSPERRRETERWER